MRAHKFLLVTISIIFICSIALAQNIDDFPAKQDPATNLSTEREKSKIYSKLKCCPCKVSFDKCTCKEATEIKAYIDALLEVGISQDDVFYKVAKKFSLNTILDEKIKANVKTRLIKEAGQKRPQIILGSDSFNFGTVNKKQGKISKIFKLSNKGQTPLIIKNIKTSCPCALVSLKMNKVKTPYFSTQGAPEDWQVEIKPREVGDLEVVLDLASPYANRGKIIREVSITSNDPINPEINFRIEAEVID